MKYLTENRKIVEKLRVTIENGSCKTSSLNNNYYILLMEKNTENLCQLNNIFRPGIYVFPR